VVVVTSESSSVVESAVLGASGTGGADVWRSYVCGGLGGRGGGLSTEAAFTRLDVRRGGSGTGDGGTAASSCPDSVQTFLAGVSVSKLLVRAGGSGTSNGCMGEIM